jgi:diguanylate cyclase (GGDEF)-like protein
MKEGVSLVLDNITGDINEKTRAALNMVFANINRLANLITDLLDISKIEAGKVQIKKVPVDINGLVRETAERWKIEAEKKKQDLEILAPAGILNIYADPDKIIQVLNNLISNSVKFTPEKGRIKVELKDRQGEAEISVSDNGVGIDKEELPKVFEKFQQFSRPAGVSAKGTGLGLAISRELVNLHEGFIKMESRLNEGSKVTFTLPKKDSETIFKEHITSGIKDVSERNTSLSLISIKISEFSGLQKEVGPDKTHRLLRDIEGVVSASLRRKADTVVRDTGELIIVLADVDKSGAEAIRQRVEEAMKKYLQGYGEDLIKDLSLNIGVAVYPAEAKTEAELLDKARGVIHA